MLIIHALTGFCIMSLLRRKRRQNRLNEQLSPATRDARTSLEFEFPEFPTTRGLRTYRMFPGLRHLLQRKTKSPDVIVGNSPKITERELKRFERNVLYDEYRKRYLDVMSNKLSPRVYRKPLNQISLKNYVDKTVTVDLPPEHPICRQREERREILFATGKTGKGGQKPRQQDNNIKLRCK